MRKYLLILLLLFVPSLLAQNIAVQTGPVILTAAGSSCTAGVCSVLQVPLGAASAGIQITGTFTATLQFEGSIDNVNWVSIYGLAPDGTSAASAIAEGIWQFNVASMKGIRVRASALTTNPTIRIVASSASFSISSIGSVAATQSGIWSTRTLDGAGNTIDSTSHALNSYVTNLTADVAEDSAFGTPASVAGRATTTERASVNTGDVVGLATDIKGRQIMMLNAPIEMKVNGNCTVNATTECDVIAANASYKICITEAAAVNTDGTNSEVVQILDNGAIGAGTLMFYLGAPSNGGHEKLLTSPYCTSAINHKITADSAGSANPVYISISGFLTAE